MHAKRSTAPTPIPPIVVACTAETAHVRRTQSVDGSRAFGWGTAFGVASLPEHLSAACVHVGVLREATMLRRVLQSLHGNFAGIVCDRAANAFAFVDRIRSYPLFYAVHQGVLRLGDDPYAIRSAIGAPLDPEAIEEFAMAGYTTGGRTLVAGVRTIQAGELLTFVDGVLRVEHYYLFFTPDAPHRSTERLLVELHEATDAVMRPLCARLGGRPMLVPLSAGLDSRFIAASLRAHQYPTITTFSYGVPGNFEANTARVIAQQLDLPWSFLPYTRATGTTLFRSPEYATYARYGHALITVPFILDFPALLHLRARTALPHDAVVINGQTGDFITGNHIPRTFDQDVITRGAFLDAIIQKHYALWRHLQTPDRLERIRARIVATLPVDLPARMDRDAAMRRYELWEWRARQSLYVINGQRACDALGIAWELPFWDDHYLDYWSSVPFVAKFQRALFRSYVMRYDPFRVFQRLEVQRYTSPWSAALAQRALGALTRHRSSMPRTLCSYWQNYSYYYALYPYRVYLRLARFHRSAISYHAKHVLETLHGIAMDTLRTATVH